MRRRLTLLLAVMLAVPAILALAAPWAAASDGVLLAQVEGDGSGAGGGDPAGEGDTAEGGETEDEGGTGQSDPDAESGASEEEAGEAVEEEVGPIWTYQMAKIVIALIVLMGLGIGLAYYRLVVQRQRAGI